ncbi:hypothetical protein RRF57_009863 [Xylaria bambusicola]|uniref:Uncharacterized protein n=1 Tax=Xylaria bambusicola TaxID=326684 RepID=A0AAN7UU43_9PEZI
MGVAASPSDPAPIYSAVSVVRDDQPRLVFSVKLALNGCYAPRDNGPSEAANGSIIALDFRFFFAVANVYNWQHSIVHI